MGKVFKAVGSLVGLSSAPKASAPQIVAKEQTKDTEDAQKNTSAIRASLFGTSGGVVGQELTSDQVKRRQTLFGN